MTRAEYEAKYGVQPPSVKAVSSEPIKMTRDEYIAKYGITPEQSKTLNKEATRPGIARDTILSSLQADTRSAETYKPTPIKVPLTGMPSGPSVNVKMPFLPAAVGQDGIVKSVGKTIVNLPNSGVNLVKGVANLAKDAIKLPYSIGGGIASNVKQGIEAKNFAKSTEERAAKDKALTERYINTQDDKERDLIRRQLLQLRSEDQPVPQQEAATDNSILNIGQALVEKPISGVKKDITGFDQGAPIADATKQAIIDRYGSLDNLQRTAVNDPGGFALDIITILEGGAGLLGKSKTLNNVLGEAARSSVIKPVTEGIKTVENLNETSKAAKIDELAQRVGQGKPTDLPALRRTLPTLNPKGAERYSDYVKQLDTAIEAKSNKFNEAASTHTGTYKIESLANGKFNHVQDAISQLKTYATKTNDQSLFNKVNNLELKGNNEGLSIVDMNNLAKMQGELRSGFNANGELASGLNKQAWENTRKGVKATERDLFGNDVLKSADAELSDLINTKELLSDLSDAAYKLEGKQEIIGASKYIRTKLAAALNLALGDIPRTLIQQAMKGGSKSTVSVLDLQAELQKNITKLKKLSEGRLPESKVSAELDQIIADNNALIERLKNPSNQLPAPKEPIINQGLPIVPKPPTIIEKGVPGNYVKPKEQLQLPSPKTPPSTINQGRPIELPKSISTTNKEKLLGKQTIPVKNVQETQKTYYHGGSKLNNIDLNKSKYSKTFFITDSAEYAKSYGGKNSVINEIELSPKAKLIDIKNATQEEISAIKSKIQEVKNAHIPYSGNGGFNPVFGNSVEELLDGAIRGKSHFAEDPALIDIYKKLGYDGMVSYEDMGMRGKNIGIWNSDIIKVKNPPKK